MIASMLFDLLNFLEIQNLVEDITFERPTDKFVFTPRVHRGVLVIRNHRKATELRSNHRTREGGSQPYAHVMRQEAAPLVLAAS
jgi:hypothetical protein